MMEDGWKFGFDERFVEFCCGLVQMMRGLVKQFSAMGFTYGSIRTQLSGERAEKFKDSSAFANFALCILLKFDEQFSFCNKTFSRLFEKKTKVYNKTRFFKRKWTLISNTNEERKLFNITSLPIWNAGESILRF